MWCRFLAVAMLVGACGSVASSPADAGGGTDGSPSAVTWRNQPADVPPAPFGGKGAGTNVFCQYTITLKQLDIQLSILPSGQVTAGHVQDLNVETVIPSTSPACSATDPGMIPANIAMYQLAATGATAGGLTLTFQGGAGNMPSAALVVVLTKVGSLYSAKLTFHRNDDVADPVLLWTVTTTVPLAPQ